jgi:hypothetical protein
VVKKVAAAIKTNYKIMTHSSLFSLGMIMITVFSILAPTSGFVAYDCMNSSNTEEAYSLLAPEECHVTGGEHKVERLVQAEVVQIKREREQFMYLGARCWRLL